MVFSSFDGGNDNDDGVVGADECCDVWGLSAAALSGSSFLGGLFGMFFVVDDGFVVITLDEVLELKEILFRDESDDGRKFRIEITLCVELISNSQPFGFWGDGGNGLREPGSIDRAALN